MVTQYDVLRVKSIEAHTGAEIVLMNLVKRLLCVVHSDIQLLDAGVELREYAVEEEEVLRNLNAVSAVKKQVERVRLRVSR